MKTTDGEELLWSQRLESRLWWEDEKRLAIVGIIYGRMPSLKNSRKIVRVGRGPFKRSLVIKSDDARQYEERVRLAVLVSNLKGVPIAGATSQEDLKNDVPRIAFDAVIYQESFARDLDIDLLRDCLEPYIYENDRAISSCSLVREIDKENPRVVFRISHYRGLRHYEPKDGSSPDLAKP